MTNPWIHRGTLLFISTFGTLLAAAGCGSPQGSEGGSCYANSTCDTGLACRSDLCVNPNDNGSGVDSGSGGTGVSTSECLSCGETQCATEFEACNGTAGCTDLMQCWIGCNNDQACVANCDVSGVGEANLGAPTLYLTCLATKCTSDCISTTTGGGGSAGVGGGSGGNGSGGGTGAGADFCSRVLPAGSCTSWEAYVMEELSETQATRVDGVDITVTDKETLGIYANFSLNENQFGVVRFNLSSAVDVASVQIDLGGYSGFAQLTDETGNHGCSYNIVSDDEGGDTSWLERDARFDYDEDGNEYMVWNGCWGRYDSSAYDEVDPEDLSVFLLRTSTSSDNFDGGLVTLRELEL